MKTFAMSGGNDGIGRGLARTRPERGDAVVVLGRSADKGQRFQAEAGERGARERAHVIAADWRLVSENRRVVGAPPAEPWSAFVEGRRIPVDDRHLLDQDAATRLDEVTGQPPAR
ncbi:hypothetical protein GCM10010294_09320 [Streptomyces griseoloalbus]|uniref:hypothetical protein n=1 Tax=Streptomyces griseoloalbus TaxID=67303 RepID=UPI00187422C7|nr:hypothetical protein GCM10010294_09320 [Streptomyces griseoloalbus]